MGFRRQTLQGASVRQYSSFFQEADESGKRRALARDTFQIVVQIFLARDSVAFTLHLKHNN